MISTTHTRFNATDCSKTGKMGVHAVFIDFRKAFDLVHHKLLLNKLAIMNINKPFWLWIKSFLSGRVQQVNLRQFIFYFNVPSGRPAHFNIYIDDLEDSLQELLKVCPKKCTGDCTEHQKVSADFGSNLQQSFNELNNWLAALNKMAINVKNNKRYVDIFQ